MRFDNQTAYKPDKRSVVRPRTARKIAAVLKVDPSEIVAGKQGGEA
jgi:hypothetical protein